ncbi:unnamed protein product [Symbiodinium natans]|uniref:Uncharacterized protein n=1 Tax=Symbiodinium natans TaxID=878477 RepID=A0A812PIS7_9DINO|nr:unnamed protein product [Symbiodinium natans]
MPSRPARVHTSVAVQMCSCSGDSHQAKTTWHLARLVCGHWPESFATLALPCKSSPPPLSICRIMFAAARLVAPRRCRNSFLLRSFVFLAHPCAVAVALASASTFGALAACEREQEGCEQAALLQVTKSSEKSLKSLWPFSGLVQKTGRLHSELDQERLDEVHKVHADMEALAKQKLVELESKRMKRNLSDYNLTQEDFGLSNVTLTLLDTVLTEMGSLLSQINASHLTDEQLLLDLAEGFVQCNTDLTARQVQSDNLSSLVNDASDSHDLCRSTEQNLSAQNATAWAAYLAKGSEAQPQEVLDCLQDFVNGYSPQTADHLQAIIDCASTLQSWSTTFGVNMTGLRDAYFGSLHALSNHSEDCRVNQSTLESHFCEYRQQLADSCLAMDECYQNVNQTFHDLLVTIAASDSRREASFIAATKVICYVNVLKANLTQPAVQGCQDLVVDTTGLAVAIPVPATKQACDTSPVADYPCNTTWQQEEYYSKSWYTGAPQIQPDTCPGPQRARSVPLP